MSPWPSIRLATPSTAEALESDCAAALSGAAVPHALGSSAVRASLLAGIRHHRGFGAELYAVHPSFARALNARRIMDNDLSEVDLSDPEEAPYCIWYPEVASEATYAALAERWPAMRYQVGRACAVAGYTDLYKRLDLLPDCSIAEEARESGSDGIYELIMGEAVKYSVMDDYTLTINDTSPAPGNLNGDTQVVSQLRETQTHYSCFLVGTPDRYTHSLSTPHHPTFNITEDFHIHPDAPLLPPLTKNTTNGTANKPNILSDETQSLLSELLTSPLPADLPTIHKDILILSAAIDGNIDRYARLRRPRLIPGEEACVVRGIYHHTPYAVWWSRQPYPRRNPPGLGRSAIDEAIAARFIMNNTILPSQFYPASSEEGGGRTGVSCEPYLIWHPTVASPSTYRELARRSDADMRPQVLRACIAGNYRDLFSEVLSSMTEIDAAVELDARECGASSSSYFLGEIRTRLAELGTEIVPAEAWKMRRAVDISREKHLPCSHSQQHQNHSSQHHDDEDEIEDEEDVQVTKGEMMLYPDILGRRGDGLYNGYDCPMSVFDMVLCMPESWKAELHEHFATTLDYESWPGRLMMDLAWGEAARDDN